MKLNYSIKSNPGFFVLLYLSVGVSMLFQPVVLAQAPIPINEVFPNQIIKNGAYGNTSGGKTQFYNTKGLWLQKGSTVHGFEVDNTGQPTGNGGTVWLNSPQGVVRLDGDINVRGSEVLNGNGGKVQIDAAYLYQSGNIFAAGGGKGGQVNINVNSATFAPGAKIDISNGTGGAININSTGIIDIKKGASMITQGLHGSDADVIQINTGFLTNNGIIRADAIQGTNSSAGTVKLTGHSYIDLQPVANAIYNSNVFTACEGKAVFQDLRQGVLKYPQVIRYSAIVNNGTISANGSDETGTGNHGGQGGNITLDTLSLINNGPITADGGSAQGNGGAGGTISATTFRIQNNSTIAANGGDSTTGDSITAGSGGHVSIHTNADSEFLNSATGIITANGGSGTNTGTFVRENGGAGGRLDLNHDRFLGSNQNLGLIEANGGNGSPGSGNRSDGGSGGIIVVSNMVNQGNGGNIKADGGFGNAIGGHGGNITAFGVVNNGLIAANGNTGIQGNDGGSISLTNSKNTGTVKANGGDSSGILKKGGNGGTIINGNNSSTNTGTLQVFGGHSGPGGATGDGGTTPGF